MQCIKYGLAKIELSHLETRQDGKAATSGNTTIGDLNFAGPVSVALYTLCCGTATPAATTMQNSAAGNQVALRHSVALHLTQGGAFEEGRLSVHQQCASVSMTLSWVRHALPTSFILFINKANLLTILSCRVSAF